MLCVITILLILNIAMTNVSSNISVIKKIEGKNYCSLDDPEILYNRWVIKETVGWWHFNEGNGDISYDSSGKGNHGGIYDAEWTTGPPGYDDALQFNAAKNSYVGIPDNPTLDFDDLEENDGFMIEFRMFVNTFPTETYSGIVCKQYKGGYSTHLTTDKHVTFHIQAANDDTSKYARSNSSISENIWYRIVSIWSNGSLYLYINDKFDNLTFVGDYQIANVEKWLDIGNDWPTDRDNPFDGKIDEVRIAVIIEDNIPPKVEIEKPEIGYFYWFDSQLWQIIRSYALIFGKITIWADARDDESRIKTVECYLDDYYNPIDVMKIGPSGYYECELNERISLFDKHEHKLKIKAVDNCNNSNWTDESTLHIWNP